jgi:hypothetical protein
MKLRNARHALSRNVNDARATKLLRDSADARQMGWKFVLFTGSTGRGGAELLRDVRGAVTIRARWCGGLAPRLAPCAGTRKSRGRATASGIYCAEPDAEAVP